MLNGERSPWMRWKSSMRSISARIARRAAAEDGGLFSAADGFHHLGDHVLIQKAVERRQQKFLFFGGHCCSLNGFSFMQFISRREIGVETSIDRAPFEPRRAQRRARGI